LSLKKRRDESLHLRDYYSILFNHRRLISVVTLLVLSLSIAYSLLVTPVYKATTTLRIEPPASESPLYLGMRNISLNGQTEFIETELEVLKSRTLAEKVVSRLGLSVEILDPRESRRDIFSSLTVGDGALMGDYLVHFTQDGHYSMKHLDSPLVVESRVGAEVRIPGLSFRISPEFRNFSQDIKFRVLDFPTTVRNFMDHVEAEPIRGTRIVELTISANTQDEARYITNTLAEIFVDQGLSTKRLEARNVREFLDDQLKVASKQVAESEENLKEFKEKNQVVILDVESQNRIEKLADFQAELERIRAERDGILKLIRQDHPGSVGSTTAVMDSAAFQQVTAFPSLITNKTIQSLKKQLIELQIRRKDLSSRFTDSYPDLQVLNDQIRLVEGNLQNTARDYLNALNEQIKALSQTVASIQKDLEKLPAKEVELAGLERKAKVNDQIYTMLLTRYKEAQINEASEIGDIRIIDPAILPEKPIRPRILLNLILALILGLSLGISSSIGIEYLDDSIKSWEDLKDLELPLLGSIPAMEVQSTASRYGSPETVWLDLESKLLTHHELRSPIAESYRNIRTNIQYFNVSRELKTILLTSPNQGEGKSTTTANLAITLAQQGQRVLIGDCDLRKPVINHIFYQRKEPGLTDVLTGKAGVNIAVRDTNVSGLSILPCGSIPPNPSELLSSIRMRELLTRLQNDYDFILLDSPPVLPVTDASILSTEVGGVILVVRAGVTRPEMIEEARDRLEKVGARVIGVVMNGLDMKRHYGKYGHYAYSYYYYYGGDGKRKRRNRDTTDVESVARFPGD
jgi:tyrosine-protein kinase Etk/Wzc